MRILKLYTNSIEQKDIPNTLKALQEEVGGYITVPYLCDELRSRDIDVYADDEGLLKDNPKPTLVLLASDNSIITILFGPIFFASVDDEGETISLTEEQVTYLKEHLIPVTLELPKIGYNKVFKCFAFKTFQK